MFELVQSASLILNRQLLIYFDQICPKSELCVQNRKSHHNRIQYFEVVLMSKFILIANFENGFARALGHHTPKKSKVLVGNFKPHVDKERCKARMTHLQLKTKANKTS